MSTYF